MVTARRADTEATWGDAPGAPVPGGEPAPVTLLVADDLDLRDNHVVQELCAANVATLVLCRDGAEALFQIGRLSPDLAVIGAALPVLAAADLIAAVRQHSSLPIAVAVGAGEADRAAAAIAAGATEIVGRPYRRQELQTVLNPLLARARARWDHESVITFGALEVDSRAYEVRAAGTPVKLTVREFELLRLLVLHADRVVTQDQIRRDIWRSRADAATSNTIAVHIRRIRARLDGAAELISVRGVGYRLTAARR